MITVHHLNNSRSQRVLWLLEELELPYEIKRYARDPVTQFAPASLRQIHPLGKSPVISDGSLNLAESGLIVEYLTSTYSAGQLMPAADSPNYWPCKYWLHYAEGSLMPYLVMKLVFDKIKTAPMPFFIRPVAQGIVAEVHKTFLGPNIQTHMDYVEAHLSQNAWFAGDELSAADFQMLFPLEAGGSRAALDGSYPHIRAYIQKAQARPAYQRALETGGPYAYA